MGQNGVEDSKFRYHAHTHTRFLIKTLSKASSDALVRLSVTQIRRCSRRNVVVKNRLRNTIFITLSVSSCPIEKFPQTHSYRANA